MKKVSKLKYFLMALVFVLGLFFLSGCRKKASSLALMISAPQNAISTTASGVDVSGVKVYSLLSDGTVKKLQPTVDYKLKIEPLTQIEGVTGYQNVFGVRAVEHISGLESELIYLVKDQANAVLPKPLLNISYNIINDPKLKTREKGIPNNPHRYIFTHAYGYKYDKDALLNKYNEKGLNIYLLKGEVVGSVKSYDLKITNDNYFHTIPTINDVQLTVNPDYDKAVYPKYYGKDGIKKGGYSEYRTTISFLKDKETKYTYLDGETLKEEVLSLGEDLAISHPVYTIGNSSRQRPIHARAGSWFDFILVIPVASILWLFGFGGSLGLAIFFGTIVIRTIAWPIYAKTNNMTLKMQEAKPDLTRLEEKYRGLTDKDSLRRKQMEMMQIYKKHKIGFSSFLLLLVQTPIFVAVYNAVYRITIPSGYFAAKFTRITNCMGFINLTQGGLRINGAFNWVTLILALLVGVSMFGVQKVSALKPKYLKEKGNVEIKTEQQKTQERRMKFVSYFMLAMMVIFAFSQNAIAFYWIIGNLYTIAQVFIQRAINKRKYLKKQHKQGLEV